MNPTQKKFVVTTTGIFLLTIFFATVIKSAGDGPSRLPGFLYLFARYDLPACGLLIIVLSAGLFLSYKTGDSWADRCLDWIAHNPAKVSIVVFIILAFGAYFCYYRHPLSMDEYMPYFQARIFAEGKLWGQFPPELVPWLLKPDFFTVYSTETGRVVSNYWPGFALLMTPFMKLGVPWLLNPLISSATLLLLFSYIRRILPDIAAVSWGVLLTLSSAVFMVNGISYYSMSAHLFLNLLYAVILLRISPGRLFMAGLVGSFALVLHNPIPHITFALPWIVWIALKKNGLRNVGMLLAGYLPILLLAGVGWVWVKYSIGGWDMAFDYGVGTAHPIPSQINSETLRDSNLPARAFQKVVALFGENFELPDLTILSVRFLELLKLFAWSIPGLPVLTVLGIRCIKKTPHLKLWAISAAFSLLVIFFMPFSQVFGWGFRYFHHVWLALPLLAVSFLTATELKNRAFWKRLICATALLSFVFCTGLRFFQARQFIGQQLSQLPELEKDKKYVCIMKLDQGYYVKDLIQNDPFFRDPVIMLGSIDEKADYEMMESMFPDAVKIKDTPSYSVWENGSWGP